MLFYILRVKFYVIFFFSIVIMNIGVLLMFVIDFF